MDKSSKNALLIWAATIAGGAGGSWATTRAGATLGIRLGPWGAVAGAVIGAVAGATLSKRILDNGKRMLDEGDAMPKVDLDDA
jgi:phage tail tape-measure protein